MVQVAPAPEAAPPIASVDLVVCQFGAMFFPDRPAAYAQARRVLRPGGRLLLNVWDRIEDNAFAGIDDYFHYDLGVTATYGILSIDLRYFGTDVDELACYGGTDLCDERFVGSAILNF